MASIKIKFRSSTIDNRKGALYYQIIHKRVVRHITPMYRIYENDIKDMRHTINQDIKRIRDIFVHFETLAVEYTADDIVSEYYFRLNELSFNSALINNIKQLKQIGRIRTSETYTAAFNSFNKFMENKDIYFDVIDSNLMIKYEAFLKKQNLTMNTISFYMRILRAVYNKGVESKLTEQNYPFKHVYTGIERTVKRAVSIETIKELKEYDFSRQRTLRIARDLFLFSFYTRGMSFIDMAYLKKSNLSNGVLTYRRKKTGQQLFIKWEKCMQEIVDRYSHITSNSNYMLPIITDKTKNERTQYINSLSYTNKRLKKISQLLNLHNPITMYVARHSWASIARKNRIPISIISEGMGHDSESTTLIYLSSLDSSAIDKANSQILKLV